MSMICLYFYIWKGLLTAGEHLLNGQTANSHHSYTHLALNWKVRSLLPLTGRREYRGLYSTAEHSMCFKMNLFLLSVIHSVCPMPPRQKEDMRAWPYLRKDFSPATHHVIFIKERYQASHVQIISLQRSDAARIWVLWGMLSLIFTQHLHCTPLKKLWQVQ